MKKTGMLCLLLAVSLSGCASPEKQTSAEQPKQVYKLYIDVESEYNLMFSKYDVQIDFDDEEIGTVANGNTFSKLIEAEEGKHTITFSKAGSSSVSAKKSVDLTGDMTFTCKIAHGSTIDLKDIEITEGVGGSELIMPDTKGMILSEAEETLKQTGFDNIMHTGGDKSVWDADNWIVTKQSIDAGTGIDRHQEITLTCMSLDDYYNELFTGKNVSEIQKMDEENWYTVEFADNSSSDMNEKIQSMDDSEKELWIAEKARMHGGDNKKAVVTLKYTGTQTPSPEAEDTEEPEVQEEENVSAEDTAPSAPSPAAHYTSNPKDTYKDGNSGKYAYDDKGKNYRNYLVIDFDEGVVYLFEEGNGSTSSDRVKITEGDLNSTLIITYHDGGSVWQNAMYFKYKNMPDHLIFQDSSGFAWDFYPTNLTDALEILEDREIYDY